MRNAATAHGERAGIDQTPGLAVSCRACGASPLETVLSLGNMPLPDALLRADELERPEPRFPLTLAFCSGCSLVQIIEEVDPELLFVENYLYFSSYADVLARHSAEYAAQATESLGLGRSSLVVEVASNDGYLLRHFVERGVPVLGIDPAPAQAEAARAAGIPTIQEFFSPEVARRVVAEGGRADLVIANNVLAHTPNPNGLVEGFSILVKPDGLVTVENTYVKDLIDRCEFDTIYHEHFSYYSCSAIRHLAGRHGLVLARVEHFPELQGGALRWHLAPRGEPDASVEAFLRREEEEGVGRYEYYAAFGRRVEALREALLSLLRELRGEGKRIAAYGAAAKGSTLVNYVGIDRGLVDYVVDRNPHKHGLHMPGVHLPIYAPDRLLEDQPDYLLLLAWNYRDEIMRQQEEFRRRGGRFIVPVPWPEIL